MMNHTIFSSWEKIKKRKKPAQEDTSDAEISDNDDNITTNDITTQHFPRFLLIESTEENQNITSLSPFVIQKVILGIAGEPDNIKNCTDQISCSLRSVKNLMPRIS